MKSTTLNFSALLLLVVGLAISGCSVVGEPVADKVADVVGKYCAKESYSARQLYRQTINAELAAEGHSVTVQCAGDPEEGG